jgi:pyrophosphatase PpaX
VELLDDLRGEGRSLGIVTAKRRKTIDLAFGVLDLERHFDAVVTADDTDAHKPDPEPVREALRRLGAGPMDTAFVGDSPFDMGAGKAAGVFTIGVGWGGLHAEEALRDAGADAIAHSLEELRGLL